MATRTPFERSTGLWLLLFVLLILTPAPVAAQPARQRAEPPVMSVQIVQAPFAAETWWGKVTGFIHSLVHSRQRMVQGATILMCLGLYIMMRK